MKLQITIEGKTYTAEVEVLEQDSIEDLPDSAFNSASAQTLPAGAYTPSRAAETHSADEKAYHSPLTGLVIKVNVDPGQQVHAGDLLLVLEAMKMENEIKAASDGIVESVNVEKGSSVKVGDLLIAIS